METESSQEIQRSASVFPSVQAAIAKPGLLIAIGFLIRILLIPVNNHSTATELFLPFLREGSAHLSSNPWSLMPPSYFPYGLTLYLIHVMPFAVVTSLFGASAVASDLVGLTLLKIPMLAFDSILLLLLFQMHKQNRLRVLLFYWLNPVVIYISFNHGQLDIATSAFTFVSVLFFIRDRYTASSIALALAVTCKFHAVVLLPFLLAAIWNREYPRVAIKRILHFLAFFMPIVIVGFLPLFLAGKGGYATLGSPEALRLLGVTLEMGQGNVVYLGLGILAMLLARLCISSSISENGILYGCASLLTLLLVVTNPAPGWFLWVAPFIASFFIDFSFANPLLLVANGVLYFLHFLVLPQFSSANSSQSSGVFALLPLQGVIFTLLQISTAGLLLFMWVFAVRSHLPLRTRLRPFAFAIAGDSGAGKNRLSAGLEKLIGKGQTRMIEGDDYHKWERGHENWQTYTHLSPRANHLDMLARHTSQLIGGRTIFQPHYDHSTGRFTAPRQSSPAKALIFQGLHTLYPRRMRDVFDLKIFLNPDQDVRLSWKIRRDVLERGHTLEKVITAMEKRMKDSEVFINPQRAVADWVIEAFPVSKLSRQQILNGEAMEVGMRHVVWNDVPLSPLVEMLNGCKKLRVRVLSESADLERTILEITGTVSREEIELIAKTLFPHPRPLTGGRFAPEWVEGVDGINQLIALTLLDYKREGAAFS